MRLIRLVILSLLVFFLLFTGISLFIPGEVKVSRAIDITGNKDSVLLQVGEITQWQNWYPGADSAHLMMKDGKAYGLALANDNTQGMVIRNVTDSSVVADLVGVKSRTSSSTWTVYPHDSSLVSVNWTMDVKLRWYPWEKFAALIFEKNYGPLLEIGLKNLKETIEKKEE